MELVLDISDVSKHEESVKQLLNYAGKETVFLFDAPMGAGKTTFIKSVCQFLNVTDAMSSPTYSIVNEYFTKSKQKIFHFDLYRIKSSQELFDIGFEEYLSGRNYVFIEWPELAIPFLDSYVRIIINIDNNNRYLRAQIIK